MEGLKLISSALGAALSTLEPSLVNAVTQVIDMAHAILVFLLGSTLAIVATGLVLHAIGAFVNLAGSLFTGRKTVGEVVAKSIGKKTGNLVVAWNQGWALAVDQGEGNIDKRKYTAPVGERVGLCLIADRSSLDVQEHFKLISDVKQEGKVVTHEYVEGNDLEDDGELVANNWIREF